MTSGEAASAGWQAISDACRRVYPDQQHPLHFGTIIGWAVGGPDPIDGISVYRAAEPYPHWHYVSYGFSAPNDRQPGPVERDAAGYGFELTFRLYDPQALTSAQAPMWPLNLMQNLARYVFESGNVFAGGDHMDLRGPICSNEQTSLSAIGVMADPDLGTIHTQRGRVQFLQILGLTAQDLQDAQYWSGRRLYELLCQHYQKGVTVLGRPSLRQDPAAAARIEAGMDTDGSSMGTLFVPQLHLAGDTRCLTVNLSISTAAQVGLLLRRRLPFGRQLIIDGNPAALRLTPGPADLITWHGSHQVSVALAPGTVTALQGALAGPVGQYQTGPVTWVTVPD